MKDHSTNYYNTLIEIAQDSPVTDGMIPPRKGDKKTVAYHQYEMLANAAYRYTSDDVLFSIHAVRKSLRDDQLQEARTEFHSKGQPCFRASPLTKRYGWGVHSDGDGKIAIYGAGSKEYRRLQQDPNTIKVKAMRSKR